MARKLLVEIIGDAAGLEGSLRRADGATSGFSSHLGGLAKAATLALGAGALGGIALVLDKSVKAAMAGQVSQARLDAALRATHQSVTGLTPALNAAEDASRKLGFADEDTRDSLAKLEIATGNTKTAVADLSVAQDIARFKHISLTAASQTLAQAMTGSQRAVKQLGITVTPVTTAFDALKASGEDLTTSLGKADEAHAKLQDRMATSKEIIQAVTDKVHGQADAFASTAAGGMEQFHAQLGHLEEGLGNTLLPIMTGVLDWVNANWPTISAVFQTVFSAIGDGVTAIKPYFDDLVSFVKTVVNFVADHWPQIRTVIDNVFNGVKQLVGGFVSVVTGLWQQFGGTIKDVVTRTFNALGPIISDVFNVIKGIFQAFSDLLHGNWSKLFDDLKNIVSNVFDAIWRILKTAISDLGDLALAIAKAILNGIGKGLSSLADTVAGFFSDTWNTVSHDANVFINNLIAFFKGIPGAILGAAESVGSTFVRGLVSGLSSLGSALLSAIKAPIDAVISAWNAIGFSITLPSINLPFVGKIGGGHLSFHVPQLPLLDVGGSILETGLAVVHKGEHVIPAGAAMAGQGGVHLHFAAGAFQSLDPRKSGTLVVEAITAWERANGPRYARA